MHLTVNGQDVRVGQAGHGTLLDLLRDTLGLTGTKRVCDRGECGACTVLLDGDPIYSCLTLAGGCEGKTVTTIEGIGSVTVAAHANPGTRNDANLAVLNHADLAVLNHADPTVLSDVDPSRAAHSGATHPLQHAFVREDAAQCGFCTPGQLMAAAALLATDASPSDATIRAAMSGNLCRCGTYPKILRAVRSVADGRA